MNIKEIVSKIKLFLAEVEFTDVKTNDGTIMSFDKELAVGGEIFVVDETGRNPAPDGEYYLEDGTKIKVMDGKIEEISQEAASNDMAPEGEGEMGMVPGVPDGTGPHGMPWNPPTGETNMSAIEMRIEDIEKDNKEMKKILSDLAGALSKKVFEDEVKMSITDKKDIEIKGEEVKPLHKPMNNYNELNTIFNNMYKNRKNK